MLGDTARMATQVASRRQVHIWIFMIAIKERDIKSRDNTLTFNSTTPENEKWFPKTIVIDTYCTIWYIRYMIRLKIRPNKNLWLRSSIVAHSSLPPASAMSTSAASPNIGGCTTIQVPIFIGGQQSSWTGR